MNTILLAAFAVAAMVGAGAGFWVYEDWNAEAPETGSCRDLPPQSAGESGPGLVRFRVENAGPTQTASFCLISKRYENVAARNVTIPAGKTADVDLRAPVGTYFAHVDFGSNGGGGHGNTRPSLRFCPEKAALVPVTLFSPGIGISGANCFDPEAHAVDESVDRSTVIPADVGDSPPLGPAFATGFGVAGLVGLMVYSRARGHFVALLLFTRLARPKILDLATRQRIHELVSAEPGIHAKAIADRLDLAQGQAMYHLHVLVRENVFVSVGPWGWRQFFVAGRYAPRRMRAMAALRLPALERLYQVLRARPGDPVTAVARRAGMSVGRVSRLARRLEQVGLAERRESGREVRLFPLGG